MKYLLGKLAAQEGQLVLEIEQIDWNGHVKVLAELLLPICC